MYLSFQLKIRVVEYKRNNQNKSLELDFNKSVVGCSNLSEGDIV